MSLTVRAGADLAEATWEGAWVAVTVAPGYYTSARPARLGELVAELASLLHQEAEPAARRTLSDAYGVTLAPPVPAGERAAARAARRAALTVVGTSGDGLVRVGRDPAGWLAEVDATVPYDVAEADFAAAAGRALADVLRRLTDQEALIEAQWRTGASDADRERAAQLLGAARG